MAFSVSRSKNDFERRVKKQTTKWGTDFLLLRFKFSCIARTKKKSDEKGVCQEENSDDKQKREREQCCCIFRRCAIFIFGIVLIRYTSDVLRSGTFFPLDDNHYYDKEREMREIVADFDTHFRFERSFVRLHCGASVDLVRGVWWSNWIGKYKSRDETVLHSSWVHCAVDETFTTAFFRKHFVYFCLFAAQLVDRKSTLTHAR